MYVSVSSKLIGNLSPEPTTETDRVAEDFLGRFARGTSFTSTNVKIVPVDNPDQAQLAIMLNGTASTDTYICERKLRVDSSASGCLSARRDLFVGPNSLFASAASAYASMSNKFDGISSNCRLIQRIAQRAFDKETDRSNAESSRRAKNRLLERFVEETAKLIDPSMLVVESISSKVRSLGSQLPPFFFRSTSQNIEFVSRAETGGGLGAISGPAKHAAGSDLQVKFHESLINNALNQTFAGVENFDQNSLRNMMENLLAADFLQVAPPTDAEETPDEIDPDLLAENGDLVGEANNEMRQTLDFNVSFSELQPVQLELQNNRLGVTVHLSKATFSIADKANAKVYSIDDNFAVQLWFKVVSRKGKYLLMADSIPQIKLAGDDETLEAAKFLEKWLAKKFNAIPILRDIKAGLKLLIDDEEKAGALALKIQQQLASTQLGLLVFEDGWFYFGLNYQGGILHTPAIEYQN